MELDYSPESVFERKHIYTQRQDDENAKLNRLDWSRTMFNSSSSRIYDNDVTENVKIRSKIELIKPDLQVLSQKVMKKTWDNKEDEFWNTY